MYVCVCVYIYVYIYIYIKSNYLNTCSIPIHHSAFFMILLDQFSCSVMSNIATPWTAALQASMSITNSWSLPKLISIEPVMPFNHLILSCPLLLLPSIFPSIWGFSNESVLRIRWPEYWSFSISLSNNIQDWFPLGCTGWISLQSKGLSRVFSNTIVQKHQFFSSQLSLMIL